MGVRRSFFNRPVLFYFGDRNPGIVADTRQNPNRPWLLAAVFVAALIGALYTFRTPINIWLSQGQEVRDIKFQPADVQAFMARAKAADAMVDPLARCLAFPDIPGSHWPGNDVRTYCQYQYGPHITPEQIGAYLDRGDVAGLEALFRKDLDRHFSKSEFSEVIHKDFESIDADDASERLTARWLAASPGSAFAHMARGYYFQTMAWRARGNAYADATPEAKMRQMAEYAGQAVEQLHQSVQLEPRMMPAYAALESIAMMVSSDDIQDFAQTRGTAEDPGCMPLSDAMMDALRPEWGGSAGQMSELSEQLAASADARPLLRMVMERSDAAAGVALYRQKKYHESVWPLSQAAFESTEPGILERLAYATSKTNGIEADLRWETIVLQLEATRFRLPPAQLTDDVANMLTLVAGETEWAISIVKRRLVAEPDNAYLHFALGRYYQMAGRKMQASEQYQLATRDPYYAPDAKAKIYQMAHPLPTEQK